MLLYASNDCILNGLRSIIDAAQFIADIVPDHPKRLYCRLSKLTVRIFRNSTDFPRVVKEAIQQPIQLKQ